MNSHYSFYYLELLHAHEKQYSLFYNGRVKKDCQVPDCVLIFPELSEIFKVSTILRDAVKD